MIELGLELNKTYTEIQTEMTVEEINLYLAYYQIKSAEKKAKDAMNANKPP